MSPTDDGSLASLSIKSCVDDVAFMRSLCLILRILNIDDGLHAHCRGAESTCPSQKTGMVLDGLSDLLQGKCQSMASAAIQTPYSVTRAHTDCQEALPDQIRPLLGTSESLQPPYLDNTWSHLACSILIQGQLQSSEATMACQRLIRGLSKCGLMHAFDT